MTIVSLNSPVRPLREAMRETDRALAERFLVGENVAALLRARAERVDDVVQRAWRQCAHAGPGAALLAIGGYGRGELFPRSDVDLLVLHPAAGEGSAWIGDLIALLWDAGLQVGHSVHSTNQCLEAARDDHAFATALLEARPLAGDEVAARDLIADAAQAWPARRFVATKRSELEARHTRLHDAAYRLEPNVKDGPGGLRDLDTALWIARRAFGCTTLELLDDLPAGAALLKPDELVLLRNCRDTLARIRFGLHLLAGRRDDRLSFDAQLKLARQFGFEDARDERAVEAFMRHYFRTVAEVEMLRELTFAEVEARLCAYVAAPLAADPRFAARDGLVDLVEPSLFEQDPGAMLDVFLLMQQHAELRGFGPTTLRGLRTARERIDEDFRAAPRNRANFLALLRGTTGVTHELRRMARYGVLGRIIPAFGAIEGRTQFDLFHAYPVDEHSLFVVSNLRRFALPRYDHEFPDCSRLMQALPRPELVHLAGLFHDLAKGRGGDHSELGAEDAEEFCLAHGLSRYEARLVAWLVRNHLLLSLTAQKRDLTDPAVINGFAAAVGDELHLDSLYLLTIADVRATNPDLWNSWKARLFRDLHHQTRLALRRGLENPLDADERITATRDAARTRLSVCGVDPATSAALWVRFGDEYFLRHTADEIVWHATALASHSGVGPLVEVVELPEQGGVAVLVYAPRSAGGFVRATAAFDQLGLTVLDARLVELADGHALETYVVLEDGPRTLDDPERLAQVRQRIEREVAQRSSPPAVTRRAPRQVRLFATHPVVRFGESARDGHTVVELVAGDRPGLLCDVGRVFDQFGVRVHAARITTVGERAEDVFFVTDRGGQPLVDPALRGALATALCQRLAPLG